MRSRETRGEVSRQINLLISYSNALQFGRTDRFIVHLGVTVRSKRWTVTMKRSIVDRFEYIASVGSPMEGLDGPFEMRFKTLCIAPLRLRSGSRDEFPTVSSRPLLSN